MNYIGYGYNIIKFIECSSGKKQYYDLAKARKIARTINYKKGVDLKSVYYCKECYAYHLSSSIYPEGNDINVK